MKEGKSFEISQYQVLEAYKRVKANRGAGGIDGVDFTEFDKDLKNNLYKLWNRMSSGSYFPNPVKGVEIPKKNGKKRLLGIPTISDRIAQMVVRMNFEPLVEPIFCADSYGYRPNRSAIDAVIHCQTKEEAERLLEKLKERMMSCKLELHPEKTKVVYCRSDNFSKRHEHESFDFLGYTFRRRWAKSKYGTFFHAFTPAVSKSAGQHLKDKIREIRKRNKLYSLEELADIMNPILRGWANYFIKFCASEARKILDFVNLTLVRFIRFKYKTVKRSKAKAFRYLVRMAKAQPNLFYHWQMGIRPTIG
ncbi:reverse transcriptase [Bacillus pseudomycoides]|nr:MULTISPECIES: group II intron maturase-specific domain-containing protein [Bacillus]EEM08252.1 Reverse transcriptase/retron type,probably (Reverse transcriptase/retron type) [Bacillus pseudomycoides]PEK40080.1 reverse transcriptase [Bacillus pseudomycoides]PEK70332.1 reverse transcriptase [Bacillus pseudomycoides]PEP37902.1 reverse transcriptase [Bacillus pseudomycoides]PEP44986.1 reverse transcriptase [Bacillus pseudomycoides]